MNSARIYQDNVIKQDARIAKVEKGSLLSLIQNLIREHGHYHNGSYDLDINTLPLSDKRLLLSHFESAEWYEYACVSAIKTEALFSEHKDYIQSLFEKEFYDVYLETMEEMRAYK